ncbi:MAG: tetratricopeptide repeat-containing sensor histidine kinase [Chitinophagaceae bacterium]|nr:tetratricopeptide repeat-containing sensor histidine kinase [Chitinophagaceae bacterium]
MQAIENYTKGIDIARQRGDKSKMAGLYLNLGALYATLPDYAKSLEAHELAVNLFNAIGDKEDISSCYMNIGLIYADLHQPNKAIEYMQKALQIFKTLGSNGINHGVSVAYEGIANTYMHTSDEDLVKMGINPSNRNMLSMDYLQKALQVAEALEDNPLVGSLNEDMGQVQEKMGNNTLAFKHYETALSIIEKNNSKESLGNIFFTLGNYYKNNKAYTNSLYYLNNSLQIGKQTGLLALQKRTLEKISNVHEQIGQLDTALAVYKQYILIRDSIYSLEKEKEITRKQMQLDFGIKENGYKLIQEITDSKLSQQLLLATQQQQQLAIKQQQLLLINKEKDLQRLTYLQKQSELQNEQQAQASLLQKNSLQAKYEKEVSIKQIAKQELQIKYDQKIKLFLYSAVALLMIIAFLIYYNQRKTVRLNKIISNQKKELEYLSNVKDRIFSVVSHDMRTPINALISFIQLLENNHVSPEKLHLYASELKNQLTHTTNLMENLLNWAASQMQGFKPMIQPLNLFVLTQDLLKALETQAKLKGIIIQNNIPPQMNAAADKDMLTVIVRNLLGNAIKYSKDGLIELNAFEEKNKTIISVKDNGAGITEKKLLQINANSTMSIESSAGTQNEKGTGLGLMLCKTFASLMHGSIVAKSTLKKGSEFLLILEQAA